MGPAVGIGCSLALCCDLIVAAESAYFLLAFVNIGLVPDGGSSLFVPSRIGMARAAELPMLGERLPAPKALEWGLINRVVPDERLARGGRRPRRATGSRTDTLLRWHQAPAEQLAVRAHGRAARAGGADPAGDGRQRRLPRGRGGVRGKAPGPVLGQVTTAPPRVRFERGERVVARASTPGGCVVANRHQARPVQGLQ